jgi:hypothetical protein
MITVFVDSLTTGSCFLPVGKFRCIFVAENPNWGPFPPPGYGIPQKNPGMGDPHPEEPEENKPDPVSNKPSEKPEVADAKRVERQEKSGEVNVKGNDEAHDQVRSSNYAEFPPQQGNLLKMQITLVILVLAVGIGAVVILRIVVEISADKKRRELVDSDTSLLLNNANRVREPPEIVSSI